MKNIGKYISDASVRNHIIPGFNVFGYEDALAIVNAAERANSPVMLMVNKAARDVMDIAHWGAMLWSIANNASVPVGVHLDHCTDINLIKRAVEKGFTSVMYDGSKLPLKENIANTLEVVMFAHTYGVYVEGEIGTVPYDDIGETQASLTLPEEAAILCKESGLDWLAVSVGNIHRLTTRKVPIYFDRLAEIEKVCPVPLVIHGASGILEEDLQKLKTTRTGKINIGTVLRKVFGDSLRNEMMLRPDDFDRLSLFATPFKRVEEKAFEIITSLSGENINI